MKPTTKSLKLSTDSKLSRVSSKGVDMYGKKIIQTECLEQQKNVFFFLLKKALWNGFFLLKQKISLPYCHLKKNVALCRRLIFVVIQQEHITTAKILPKPIPFGRQEPFNRLFLKIPRHQMHLNHLNAHRLKRHRLQHLQLRPTRLQTQIIYISHIHRQHQRIQRKTLHPRIETILIVETVRGDAVDFDTVTLLLVEGHLLGVGGGAETGMHGLRTGTIVPFQVKVVAGIGLDEEAPPRHLAFEVFGFGGFAVVVGARLDEETSLLLKAKTDSN